MGLLTKPLLAAVVAAVLPGFGAAQATGEVSVVVQTLAEFQTREPWTPEREARHDALRAELNAALVADPTGVVAQAWFGPGVTAEDGTLYGLSNYGPADFVVILDEPPLLEMDRAWLAAWTMEAMFGAPLIQEGSCLGQVFFELQFRAPLTTIETNMKAAAPAFAEVSRLQFLARVTLQAAILSGDTEFDRSQGLPAEDLRSQVFGTWISEGQPGVYDHAERGYFIDDYTGSSATIEEVVAVIQSLSEDDIAMLDAAQPFFADLITMIEAGVSTPAEVLCRPR